MEWSEGSYVKKWKHVKETIHNLFIRLEQWTLLFMMCGENRFVCLILLTFFGNYIYIGQLLWLNLIRISRITFHIFHTSISVSSFLFFTIIFNGALLYHLGKCHSINDSALRPLHSVCQGILEQLTGG